MEQAAVTKSRCLSLHRAARRAMEAAGHDGFLDRKSWHAYLARTANVGSTNQVKAINWRLEALGLMESDGKEGVRLLATDYADIVIEA